MPNQSLHTEQGAQVDKYGVLVGSIKDGNEYKGGASPHYVVWVTTNEVTDANYRIAVNVESVDDSEDVAYYDPNFQTTSPKLNFNQIAQTQGFTELSTGPAGNGLDYIRDNLFPLQSMAPVPADGQGVTLSNILDAQIERAKADTGTIVFAFGDYFSTPGQRDPNFGFEPEKGIHDIHMMQGDTGKFAQDDRINGDGALFIRFSSGETIALFVRFGTQTTTTDNNGHPI